MYYNELTNNIIFNKDALQQSIFALNQQQSYLPEQLFLGIQTQTYNRITNEVLILFNLN
jgi:hypothetical protein